MLQQGEVKRKGRAPLEISRWGGVDRGKAVKFKGGGEKGENSTDECPACANLKEASNEETSRPSGMWGRVKVVYPLQGGLKDRTGTERRNM